MASIRVLSGAAKNSPQVTQTDVATVSENGGEALPQQGKELPAQVADSAGISEAVSRINEIVQSIQRDLSFNLDEDSGQTIIRVIDSESGELIRQIPSEEALAIANRLRDLQKDTVNGSGVSQGLLFSDRT
ncbi:MAG: flagellar protein FlaG [Gammaproteobacteria bacterium]|nr:flagellar protein FlaG [Gammaproteobacteria bacterium]